MDFPIRTLARNDYPPLLSEIPDQPTELHIRGTLPLWQEHKILAVVGSRHHSSYGKEVTRVLIEGLRGYPVIILSGLALGIDGIAHVSALSCGLTTIAVPGSGLADHVLYPRSHRPLARRILESGGALLSEYAADFRATQWSFPKRNRIMAGMAHAVLIIEATEKSGTLITARLATEYNRDVLTVPGSIFSSLSFGPHTLIRDGATPVTSSHDILTALGLKIHTPTPAIDATPEEQVLLALLDFPLTRDELIRAAKRPAHETAITLSLLELRGYIRESDGIIMRTLTTL